MATRGEDAFRTRTNGRVPLIDTGDVAVAESDLLILLLKDDVRVRWVWVIGEKEDGVVEELAGDGIDRVSRGVVRMPPMRDEA